MKTIPVLDYAGEKIGELTLPLAITEKIARMTLDGLGSMTLSPRVAILPSGPLLEAVHILYSPAQPQDAAPPEGDPCDTPCS